MQELRIDFRTEPPTVYVDGEPVESHVTVKGALFENLEAIRLDVEVYRRA